MLDHRWTGEGDFLEWYVALTDAQQEWLRSKARWEAMSVRAVAREWAVPSHAECWAMVVTDA